MDKSFTKQIDKNTYISVDQAYKNDYGCRRYYRIINGRVYVENIEYFKGEDNDNN